MTETTAADRTPPLVRFIDGFLQEQNIKWVLTLGALILLGSSVMLVSSHWQDYTPAWKYLIMLGYTGLIFSAGQWSYHKLALRKTGTILQALTVLLLPALFFALHWVQTSEDSLWVNAPNLLLLGITFAFTTLAAGRIFEHFLRKPQPTFLAGYVILSVAGALAPALPDAAAPWASLGLWTVFALSTIKVNRHIFWLGEEHRAPRILGFFPIALLGTLFAALFTLNFAAHIALEWLGLGLVLVAIPILLTADSVARVFQQRTGDLVWPYPAAVILPLLLGLVLCAAGLALTGIGLTPNHSPLAIAPTAALTAAMMALAARRTQRQAFVWALLVSATLAYNFSPFFFQDLALKLLDAGASAVREERLPYAFYGLTYLPLIATLTLLARRLLRSGNELFGVPLRRFSVGLSCVLLALALGHIKAMFPVASAMLVVFVVQTLCYRRRWLALPALCAWVIVAFAAVPFVTDVLGVPLWRTAQTLTLACAALLLIWPGAVLDRCLARLSVTKSGFWQRLPLCLLTSLGLSLVLAAHWLLNDLSVGRNTLQTFQLLPMTLLAALLFVHTWRWRSALLGCIALLFIHWNIGAITLASRASLGEFIAVITGTLLAQWALQQALKSVSHKPAVQAFRMANSLVFNVGLLLAFMFVYLPQSIIEIGFAESLGEFGPAWIFRFLVLAWLFAAARNSRYGLLTVLACIGTLAHSGAMLTLALGSVAWSWLPALWTTLAVAALAITPRLRRDLPPAALRERALIRPLEAMSLLVLAGTGLLSLSVYLAPVLSAGLLASAGLFAYGWLHQQARYRSLCLALLSWQLVVLAVAVFASERIETVFELGLSHTLPSMPVLALAASCALMLWKHWLSPLGLVSQTAASVQNTLLRLVTVCAIVASLDMPTPGTTQLLAAVLVFLLWAGDELWSACRQQRELRVVIAECLLALAVGYLVWHGAIEFGRGLSLYILLGLGFGAWSGARISAGHQRFGVMTRPLRITGLVLPLLAVGIAVFRHLAGDAAPWLGYNSLALLLAAAFYFWRGLADRQSVSIGLAALIFNLALALLWRELSWSDPQLYMIPVGVSLIALVRLLRVQIPERLHNPLYYLGALLILVSPLFHIATGSWLHLFTLMLASVVLALAAIGLRNRPLLYTASAFLIADLLATVVRGSIDNPSLLWIAGLTLGLAVLGLGALAERNREILLQRLRAMSATLQTWQ